MTQSCRFKAALEAADGISMGHLKENSKSVFSGFNFFGSVPDTDAGTSSQHDSQTIVAHDATAVGTAGRALLSYSLAMDHDDVR